MRRLLLLAALLLADAAAAETLGRFFFTPAERVQLDRARTQKQQSPKTSAPEPEPPQAPQVLSYDGIVRRSDGRAVLWINSRPLDEKEALSSASVSGRVRADGVVTLHAPQGRSIELKVGQSVELNSGTVAERLARRLPAEHAPAPRTKTAAEPAPQPLESISAPAAEEVRGHAAGRKQEHAPPRP